MPYSVVGHAGEENEYVIADGLSYDEAFEVARDAQRREWDDGIDIMLETDEGLTTEF